MAKTYQVTDQRPNIGYGSQKYHTYEAVKAAGENGITREQICANTGLPKQRVWFYLSELRRAGLIRRMGDAVDPTLLSPDDAKLYALNALENAFVVGAVDHASKCTTCRRARAESDKCSDYITMSKNLARYNKIKALALGAKTRGEESAALRMALLDLVKMVF